MQTLKMHTYGGDSFDGVAKKAKDLSKEESITVEFDFNGIQCLVSEKTVTEWLWRDYQNAHVMNWKTIGPDCGMQYDCDTEIELYSRKLQQAKDRKKAIEESDKHDKEQRSSVDGLLDGITLDIVAGKEGEYAEYVATNSKDGYSRGIVDYAEYWAKLMQKEVATGKQVSEVADECQKPLGFLGITGFMYGCAVKALAHFWIHGEDLRKWHNKQYGVSEEKKGTVNPAIITFNV